MSPIWLPCAWITADRHYELRVRVASRSLLIRGTARARQRRALRCRWGEKVRSRGRSVGVAAFARFCASAPSMADLAVLRPPSGSVGLELRVPARAPRCRRRRFSGRPAGARRGRPANAAISFDPRAPRCRRHRFTGRPAGPRRGDGGGALCAARWPSCEPRLLQLSLAAAQRCRSPGALDALTAHGQRREARVIQGGRRVRRQLARPRGRRHRFARGAVRGAARARRAA